MQHVVGRVSKNLPARTSEHPPVEVHERRAKDGSRRGGKIGNRGGKKPPNSFRTRMQLILERAKACEVTERIISGDISEVLGSTKTGELIVGTTKNRDRLAAIELASRIGYGLPGGAPVAEGTTVFVIVAPAKAKTAEQWLKQHKKGVA